MAELHMLKGVNMQIFVGDGNMITLQDNSIDIFQMPHLRPRQVDVDGETSGVVAYRVCRVPTTIVTDEGRAIAKARVV
jgi:hypothetical protein